MGKMDIDYQVLHDAFFKYQTKPKLMSHGDLYHEGKEFETLDDLLRCYQNTCSILPKTHDQMLLRYEYQKDHSLISEAQFSYDPSWFKSQLKCCLEFWRDEREASYAPEEERWKCKFCKYASICPTSIKPEEAAQTTQS